MRTTPVLSDSPNGQGFWEIRWSEKRGGQWRSMRRSTRTADRTEAELVLGRFMISRAQAPVEMVGRATVDDCSAYYLREWSLPRGNDVTDDFVLRPVRRGMGRMLADAVTQDDVDAYARARSKGLYGKKGFKAAPSTIRREVTGLQAMLNFCSRKGMIGGRPTFAFDKPAAGQRRDLWLTEADERAVLARAPEASLSVRFIIEAGLSYGVRLGAMMDLRFGAQVSFLSGMVDFNVPGARLSRKRRPVAVMTPAMRSILEELFKQAGRAHVLDRTAPGDFERFMSEIGYGWVTPHVLKHSAITLQLRGGARPEDVSAATATDIKTILSVYRHHSSDELLATVRRRRV